MSLKNIALAAISALSLTAPTVAIASPSPKADYSPPPVAAKFDYQLYQPYEPVADVKVVTRDRTASISPGRYNICYINAFQTQRLEREFWKAHDDLLLRKESGEYIYDPNSKWKDEILLDIRTDSQRKAIAGIMRGWMKGCKEKGFDAVELDNMDSYSRAPVGVLNEDQAKSLVELLVTAAHKEKLAVSQKNSAGFLPEFSEGQPPLKEKPFGMDFVVVESCVEFNECERYINAYQRNMIQIEYKKETFDAACKKWGKHHSIVRRDELATDPESGVYDIEWCPGT